MALDPGIAESDEAGARRFAARLAGTAKTTTASGKGETVADYASRWLAQRPAKTARDNVSHLKTHVLPVIGHQSILSLTSSHGDDLVAALDAKIAAGTMSDKRARNVWGTVGADAARRGTRQAFDGSPVPRREPAARRPAAGAIEREARQAVPLPERVFRVRLVRRGPRALAPERGHRGRACVTASNARCSGRTSI
jgi:hypothetical protein